MIEDPFWIASSGHSLLLLKMMYVIWPDSHASLHHTQHYLLIFWSFFQMIFFLMIFSYNVFWSFLSDHIIWRFFQMIFSDHIFGFFIYHIFWSFCLLIFFQMICFWLYFLIIFTDYIFWLYVLIIFSDNIFWLFFPLCSIYFLIYIYILFIFLLYLILAFFPFILLLFSFILFYWLFLFMKDSYEVKKHFNEIWIWIWMKMDHTYILEIHEIIMDDTFDCKQFCAQVCISEQLITSTRKNSCDHYNEIRC